MRISMLGFSARARRLTMCAGVVFLAQCIIQARYRRLIFYDRFPRRDELPCPGAVEKLCKCLFGHL